MINITRLYCETPTPGDRLRYSKEGHIRPIVIWNCTRRCNLKCIHCYSDSFNKNYEGELTKEEARRFIEDIAAFGAPVLLFSGGEPLLRKDIFELATYAKEKGLRTVISTNGTLIKRNLASRIKKAGVDYVGISLDGIGETNDRFRGTRGAFEMAMRGFRNCVEVKQKVGLRLTLTKQNFEDLPGIFDFIEEENIDRACFYHLVYSGRGSAITKDDLSGEETRRVIDYIIERTSDFHRRGQAKDILTVDNHADGVYVYLKLKKEDPQKAERVLELLKINGGNSSGVGVSNVDNQGNVHADQFWTHYTFGNVKERKFSEIWMDTSDNIMKGLKDRKSLLKGRCRRCRWINICNGNFRVRAEAVYEDIWAEDPACYLSEEEI